MHVDEKDTKETKGTHTPGPWRSDGGTRRTFEIFTNADIPAHRHIATVEERGVLKPSEGEANARLIASAPDLLAHLKSMTARFMACLAHNGTDAEFAEAAVAEADAVVAKAEGR